MLRLLIVLAVAMSAVSLEAAQVLPVNGGLEGGPKVILKLEADEVAIFGYGSLMLAEMLEYTTDGGYTGPYIMTRLTGFKRTWSAKHPNESYLKDKEGKSFISESVTFLNVERCDDWKVNGMLFVASMEDLEIYDQREACYDRVRINDLLEEVMVIGGDAYVYTAKPEYYSPTEGVSREQTIIRLWYVRVIKEALDVLGEDFRAEFRQNTQALPFELVF